MTVSGSTPRAKGGTTKEHGRCRLCGIEGPFAESHIIPRALVRDISTNDDPMRQLAAEPGQHPKRLRTGPYAYFVCERCERSFSPWDTYGVEFLRRTHPSESFRRFADGLAVEDRDIDYSMLKMFALVLLWRAAVCGLEDSMAVNLGRFEEVLRDQISDGDPGEEDDFAVTIDYFPGEPGLAWIPWTQVRTLKQRVRFYQLPLHRHLIRVKVDSRVEDEIPEELLLRPGSPLLMPVRDFTDGPVARQFRAYFAARDGNSRSGHR